MGWLDLCMPSSEHIHIYICIVYPSFVPNGLNSQHDNVNYPRMYVIVNDLFKILSL